MLKYLGCFRNTTALLLHVYATVRLTDLFFYSRHFIFVLFFFYLPINYSHYFLSYFFYLSTNPILIMYECGECLHVA